MKLTDSDASVEFIPGQDFMSVIAEDKSQSVHVILDKRDVALLAGYLLRAIEESDE